MTKKKFIVPEFLEPVITKDKPLGSYWCCYCGSWEMFELIPRSHGYVTYPICIGCGISLEDWYIKKVNGIWKSQMGITDKKKVKKK
jgi:Pyruvate/2-oxoacid:ferredoxin oxidoreductase delta subunit